MAFNQEHLSDSGSTDSGSNSLEKMARRSKQIFILLLFTFVLWGLSGLVIRLHLTHLAYEFEGLKRYHRSLKEEEIRLRAKLAEELSISQIQSEIYREPEPSQVVRMP
jgi:hypothetical protein